MIRNHDYCLRFPFRQFARNVPTRKRRTQSPKTRPRTPHLVVLNKHSKEHVHLAQEQVQPLSPTVVHTPTSPALPPTGPSLVFNATTLNPNFACSR